MNSNKDAPGKMEGFPIITLKDHFTRHVLARNNIFFMRKVSDDSYKLATEEMYYNNFDSNVYVKNANIEWR